MTGRFSVKRYSLLDARKHQRQNDERRGEAKGQSCEFSRGMSSVVSVDDDQSQEAESRKADEDL